MALYPCSIGRHGYRGRALHVYPALVSDYAQGRTHLRVCQRHYDEITTDLDEAQVRFDEKGDVVGDEHPRCLTCGNETNGSAFTLFVTAYPQGDEPANFWGKYHRDCKRPAWLPTNDELESLRS